MALSNYGGLVRLLLCADVAYKAKVGGGTIAGINEVDQLAEGAIAVFDETNTLVETTTTVANLINVAKFWIARGGVNGRYWRTPLIERTAATRTKKVGAVPVKGAIAVGQKTDGDATTSMNLPATLVAGEIASLTVVDITDSAEITSTIRRYEYTVLPADTDETVIQGLAAVINADPDRIVDATLIADTVSTEDEGILLTAIDYYRLFDVGVDDIIEFADVTRDGTGDSVVPTQGANAYTEMKELELVHSAVSGLSDTAGQRLLYTAPSLVDSFYATQAESDTPVDVWTLGWVADATGGVVPQRSVTQEVVVGFINGSTVLANFETMLGVLLLAPDASEMAS